MTQTIQERLRDGAGRFLKWVYKEEYSGPPVISIPRHPDNIDALMAEAADTIDALAEALAESMEEIDRYIWQEYPLDHPVHERYRQRDFSANPARAALAKLRR
nr:hypothetical protein [uncultured Roseovarius sp.]